MLICRMLAEFQSRKAHCVQVKEKDILRILFFISIAIIGYLLGWTFVNIDHAHEDLSLNDYLLGHGHTYREKRYFRTCQPRSWDFLVQMGTFFSFILHSFIDSFIFYSSRIYFSLCGHSIYL